MTSVYDWERLHSLWGIGWSQRKSWFSKQYSSMMSCYMISTVNMISLFKILWLMVNVFLRYGAKLAVSVMQNVERHIPHTRIFKVVLENGNEFQIWGQSQASVFQKCHTLWTFFDFKIIPILCSKTSYYIYCSNCTIIRCNNLQICGIPTTCFSLFQPSSGRYSTKKNAIMTISIIRCAMVELKYKF